MQSVSFWRGLALGLVALSVGVGAWAATRGGAVVATPTLTPVVVERTVAVRVTRTSAPVTPSQTPHPPATPMPPTPTVDLLGGGGTLAFVVRVDGYARVYAWTPGVGTPVALTEPEWAVRDPAWAPDGTRLAYAARREGNWDVYVLDVGTGSTRRITSDAAFDARPAWSPDGQWLMFESTRAGNLDIYLTSVDGAQVYQVTGDALADYAPTWAPDGRSVVYVSWRSGNPDLWQTDLSNVRDDLAVNLTNTPGLAEDHPVWAPDGSALAYDVSGASYALVYRLSLGGEAHAIGQGRLPTWAPNGQSLAVTGAHGLDVLAAQSMGVGRALYVGAAEGSSWTAARVTVRALAGGTAVPLYAERVATSKPYALVELQDVDAPQAELSERVDDSFAALRARVRVESGWDVLGWLDEATRGPRTWVTLDDEPESWHYAGRAFDVREDDLLIVKDAAGAAQMWRVYVLAAAQDGTQGEPLRVQAWNFDARWRGGPARVAGGALGDLPTGGVYVVDFTALAADYGWQAVAARPEWQTTWAAIRAWHFERRDGLMWSAALQEVGVAQP